MREVHITTQDLRGKKGTLKILHDKYTSLKINNEQAETGKGD